MTRSDGADVVVLGASGMLGHRIVQQLAPDRRVAATIRSTGTDDRLREALAGAALHTGIEAENTTAIEDMLDRVTPRAVVNCIGVIKQLAAAKDPIASIEINALFPHRLARLTSARGIRLVHFSTDCVFSGDKGNYRETDEPDARDLYGRTKLLGEVAAEGCITLRTSIIGHELNTHVSLLDWFVDQRGGEVNGFANALYSGLTTSTVAELVRFLLDEKPELSGLWHVSGEPISKYDLLCLVNEIYRLGIRVNRDENFRCDRRLDSTNFRKAAGWQPESWAKMIANLHSESRAS